MPTTKTKITTTTTNMHSGREDHLNTTSLSNSAFLADIVETTSSLSLAEALSFSTAALSSHAITEMVSPESLELVIRNILAILDDSFDSMDDYCREKQWGSPNNKNKNNFHQTTAQ
jgi:hypothetical protein